MKKEQKIIELRRAAKLKVAELRTKIAFAHSEAAKERARMMWDRAAELEGLEAGGMERFDVLAKYRAKLAGVNEMLEATVAQCKAEIQQTKCENEKMCAAAEDDPEPEKEQFQQTVYCDGSEHSARIVARRLINKMPHIQKGGYLFVHIIRNDGGYFVGVSEQGEKHSDYVATVFSKNGNGEKEEAQFIQSAREMFKGEDDEGSAKEAGPMSRALDALFGGNPVEQVDNLISDTVKSGKEGSDE